MSGEGRQGRDRKAENKGHVVKPAATIGDWSLVLWANDGESIKYLLQNSPTHEPREPGYLYANCHSCWLRIAADTLSGEHRCQLPNISGL